MHSAEQNPYLFDQQLKCANIFTKWAILFFLPSIAKLKIRYSSNCSCSCTGELSGMNNLFPRNFIFVDNIK